MSKIKGDISVNATDGHTDTFAGSDYKDNYNTS